MRARCTRLDRLESGFRWMRTDGLAEYLELKLRVAVETKRLFDFMERKAAIEEAARAKAERERVARLEREEKARAEAARLTSLPPKPPPPVDVVAEMVVPFEDKAESPPSMDTPEDKKVAPIYWGGIGCEHLRVEDDDKSDVPEVLHEYDPLACLDDDEEDDSS